MRPTAFYFLSLALCLFSCFSVIAADYIAPVKSRRGFSGMFGEIRSNHLHSGLDYRIERVGEPVYAVAAGYVERINVRPNGFGVAVYVNHPTQNTTSVYAHLDALSSEMAQYVKQQQYERSSFSVDLSFPPTTFKVTQGRVIGYAGNSGSSGGPHLHFEVRNSATQTPLNPFTYHVVTQPQDDVFPTFRKIFVYTQVPFEDIYITDKRQLATAIPLGKGKFKSSKDTLEIEPHSYFGFDVLDYMATGGLRVGVYKLRLSIDGQKTFEFEVSSFPFDKTRYCNYLIDFAEKQQHNINVIKTYRASNNLLPVYTTSQEGIIRLPLGEKAKVEVELWDHAQNGSKLSFWIKSVVTKPHTLKTEEYTKVYPATGGLLKTSGLLVNIPPHALYEPALVNITQLPPIPQALSEVYQIYTPDVPLHQNITLTFIPPVLQNKADKMTIYQLDQNGRIYSLSTTRTPYSLTAYTTNFGTYFVGLDTISPTITTVNCKANENMQSKPSIILKVKDGVSSIGYYGTIDGKWALFEYDQKNDLMIYKFDRNYLVRNKKHKLIFTATDNNKNATTFITDFYW